MEQPRQAPLPDRLLYHVPHALLHALEERPRLPRDGSGTSAPLGDIPRSREPSADGAAVACGDPRPSRRIPTGPHARRTMLGASARTMVRLRAALRPTRTQKRPGLIDLTVRFNPQEAPPGFEPGIKDLQSSALPLGHGAKREGSGQRLLPPPFATRAGNRTRTGDPNLGKVVLYQLSYSRNVLQRTPT